MTIVLGFAGGVGFISGYINVATNTIAIKITTLRRGTFRGTIRNGPIVGAILYGIGGIECHGKYDELIGLCYSHAVIFGFGINVVNYHLIGFCGELNGWDAINDVALEVIATQYYYVVVVCCSVRCATNGGGR